MCARASCDLEKLGRAAEQPGNLVMLVAFDVVQPDDTARQRRQSCQRTLEIG